MYMYARIQCEFAQKNNRKWTMTIRQNAKQIQTHRIIMSKRQKLKKMKEEKHFVRPARNEMHLLD